MAIRKVDSKVEIDDDIMLSWEAVYDNIKRMWFPYLCLFTLVGVIAFLFPHPIVYMFLLLYVILAICNPPITVEEHMAEVELKRQAGEKARKEELELKRQAELAKKEAEEGKRLAELAKKEA